MQKGEMVLPNWILQVAYELGLKPIQYKKILMGVVADVWCVLCNDGEYYIFKKSVFSKVKSSEIARQLCKAREVFVLPTKFNVLVEAEYLYVVYSMVLGAVQIKFNKALLHRTCDLLHMVHKNTGFIPIPSIYHDIIENAEIVLNSNEINSLECIEIVKTSANRILKELDYTCLENMLNCRGFLTHGDVKPNNIIFNKRQQPVLVDWEKLCSVSPEFDFAYCLFYANDIQVDDIIIKNKYKYNVDILSDCLNFIHDLHLIYDCYVFLNTGDRGDYIIKEILPLYTSWEKNKNKYMEIIK